MMLLPCDSCDSKTVVLFCRANSAKLCISCDQHVHSANALSLKHVRSQICDNSRNELAAVRCATDNLVLYNDCDSYAHNCSSVASSLHARHHLHGFSGCPPALEVADALGIEFREIIGNHADLIFANSDEARAFCNFDAKESSVSVTRYLSHYVPLVSVTDGHRGSYTGLKGEAVYIPPSPCVPVYICGAGDAYACGILYGVLRSISDLKSIGSIAAKVAATVVGQQGTRFRVSDAVKLGESFTFHTSTIGSVIGTDHISSV